MIELPWFSSPLMWLFQALVAAGTITSTQKGSPTRLVVLVFVAYLAYLGLMNAPKFTSSGTYNGYVGANNVLMFFHITNLLWTTGIDGSDLKPKKGHPAGSSSKFSRAFHIAFFNMRGIGTPWQAKNVPPFPAWYSNRSNPSRVQFLIRQMAFFIWYYLLLDMFGYYSTQQTEEELEQMFGNGVEFSLLDATAQQWATRVIMGLLPWILAGRAIIDWSYRFWSLVFVGIGISSPNEFPPLFGNVSDSYTIRNFWGQYWHQMLRWDLTSISSFLTQRVMRLPKPSILERYTNILFVFTISAVIHAAQAIVDGSGAVSNNMIFFQSFAIGIMIEDATQELWRRFSGRKKLSGRKEIVPVWKKTAGFLWVAFFMAVVSPIFIYPTSVVPVEKRWIVQPIITEKLGAPAMNLVVLGGGLFLKFVFKAEP